MMSRNGQLFDLARISHQIARRGREDAGQDQARADPGAPAYSTVRRAPGPSATPDCPADSRPQPRADEKFELDTLASDYPRGHHIGLHAHGVDQIVFAKSGVMQVWADEGTWVVPPARALWMPAKVAHMIHCTTAVAMRTIYLRGGSAGPQSGGCAVVTVTPLMREIIVRLVEGLAPQDRSERLAHLLLDELQTVAVAPLHLPDPHHPALRTIAGALRDDPADRRGLYQWARSVGLSRRTLARRFVAETGLTFGAWRRQLRFLAALQKLAAGVPVTRVAFDAGYDSVSAFIHAFRRTLGVTPGRYFEDA